MKIGLDVGSTTLKCVAIDANENIVYKKYIRHFSQITSKSAALLTEIASEFPECKKACIVVSGSAGMGFAQQLGLLLIILHFGMEHRESYDKDKGEQKPRHHVGIGKPVCNFLVSVFSSFHLTISAQRLL